MVLTTFPVPIFGFQDTQRHRVDLDFDGTAINCASIDFVATVVGPDPLNFDAQFPGFPFDSLTRLPVAYRTIAMIVSPCDSPGSKAGANNCQDQYSAHRVSFHSSDAALLSLKTDMPLKPETFDVQLDVSL
jgi:hypothetical protein